MTSFWIIVGTIVVISLIAGLARSQASDEAKKAYQQSLLQLKADPTNASLRQTTLELGRRYSNLTRNGKGVALFDEVALMNDLNAAAGGTMALAQASGLSGAPGAAGPPPAAATVEERLEQLARLKGKGLVTDAEYEKRRAAMLEEL